jgi:ferritin
MLSDKLQGAFNEQINAELYSAYLYLSMAAYFESINFEGFAHWMRRQAAEEQEHAMKFFDFIYDRGGRVELRGIDGPPVRFESPLDVFSKTYAHEQKVTGLINNLYALAAEEQDYASQGFLQWYVNEQVEEEKTTSGILETLKMISEKVSAMIMLDRELGKR